MLKTGFLITRLKWLFSIFLFLPCTGTLQEFKKSILTSVFYEVADWRSGERRGLRTKGSLVRDLAGSPFVVALSKSH